MKTVFFLTKTKIDVESENYLKLAHFDFYSFYNCLLFSVVLGQNLKYIKIEN